MASIENRLYCKISTSMALQRTGALAYLRPTRMITIDGEYVPTNHPRGLFPGFCIQDLIVNPFKSQLDFELCGNIQVDVKNAAKLICRYLLEHSPNPFRVWSIDRYVNEPDLMTVLLPGGSIQIMKKTNREGVYILSADNYLLKNAEVEVFTGRVDGDFIPIMENDAVLADGEESIKKVVRYQDIWKLINLGSDASDSLNLHECESIRVIGSARNSVPSLTRIANAIKHSDSESY